ncbi:MAG: cation acetate symporter, partial [Mesorhizobium sp.]
MANTTSTTAGGGDFTSNLGRIYGIYTGGFIAFIILMAVLSAMGVENVVIGYLFMGFTIVIYAVIGILSRTMHVGEYYVAGRRVPALYNGMATGADWMSAASFIGMAGSLYLLGYDGLGFVLGWTGGYVLVAILVAPYLRKFGAYTVPDFLSARYGGNLARFIGVIVLFSCSFTYVVAQIFGTGLISARFLGIDFNVAVYVGLAGILVCSMLGGMRAVTWTQVAQYIVLIIAYLIPAIWMSTVKTGIPIPQLMQGQALANITALETAQGITLHHITPFAHGGYDAKNYFLLILCLMIGTASLPHVLMRYFTTPSVREARVSVAWSLLFIFILYFTAPAYAAFAKWTMLDLVASGLTPENIAEKAGWMMRWAAADNTLVQICGKAATDTAAIVAACAEKGVTALSFADINLNADMIVLATPE